MMKKKVQPCACLVGESKSGTQEALKHTVFSMHQTHTPNINPSAYGVKTKRIASPRTTRQFLSYRCGKGQDSLAEPDPESRGV